MKQGPCCHIGCEKLATQLIVNGHGPDDNTEMCDEHAPEYTSEGDAIHPIAELI